MSIRRNTFYNLVGSFFPLLSSLITIPLYIGLIGEDRYGILAIIWLLLGYFGLFDLGLGRATAQSIATRRDSSDKERAQVFWTALLLNLGLGVLGGLLVWPIFCLFFDNIFKVDEALRPEIYHAIPWLILALPMAIFSGTLTGALQGRERFFELNLISMMGALIFQILPLIVAQYISVELGILLPAVLFARFFTLLALFGQCKRHIALGYPISFHHTKAKLLLRFGGWVTITSFVGPMMVILDRIIIGSVLGAKSVTYYTVPFQLAERTALIPSSLTTALFPRFSAVTLSEQKVLADEAMNILIVTMTPIIAICILFIKPFLLWWVGVEFAHESVLVGQVVLIGFWVNGFARVPFALLQARGKPGLIAKCHLIELLPYFVLLYFALNNLGLLGASLVFTFRVFIDFILLSGLSGSLGSLFRICVIPVIFLAIGFFISYHINIEDVLYFIYVFIYMLFVITWAWWKAPNLIKNQLFGKFKRL